MKQGTEYARKIKRLFTRLKKDFDAPADSEPTDPVDQLLFGILHRGASAAEAGKVLKRLNEAMVDRNELRVSSPAELIDIMGPSFPYATQKAKAIIAALNDVFAHYDALTLEPLKDKGKRDARKALEDMNGVDPSVAAGVMLFSLEGHAIPVDEMTEQVLRADDLVHPEADVSEIQAFLERNVPAAQAKTFTHLLRRYAESRIKDVTAAAAKAKAAEQAKAKAEAKAEAKAKKKTSTKKTKSSKAKTKKAAEQKPKAKPKKTAKTRRARSSGSSGKTGKKTKRTKKTKAS